MRPQDISILVVDDEVDVREVLQETFEAYGFQVASAADGQDAYEKLNKLKFQLVVTDLRMPRMSGRDLIKKIRQKNHSEPKILAISGYSESSVEELLEMGCDGFFSKPFNAESVRAAIKKVLLKPEQQWSTNPGKSSSYIYFKKFESSEEMLRSKEVRFGRSGISLSLKENIAPVGEVVEFSIRIGQGLPWKELSGFAKVVWSRGVGSDQKPAGVGLEFIYIKNEDLQTFNQWLAQQPLVASVPC